jgi:hypothetical protein
MRRPASATAPAGAPPPAPSAALLACACACAIGTAVAACGPKNNGTLMVVRVDTELAVPSQLDAITVDLDPERGDSTTDLFSFREGGAPPVMLGFRPDGPPDFGVDVVVTGLLGDSPVVTQAASVRFVPGQAREFSLLLSRDCAVTPSPCASAPGSICVKGPQCLDKTLVAEIRPYTPGGGGRTDAGGDGPGPTDGGRRDARENPGRWEVVPHPAAAGAGLNGVWPIAPDDVWVVGAIGPRGVAYHYAQGAWAESPLPALAPGLYAVWASAPGDVWAVGVGGTILHFNGTVWSSMEIGGASSPTLSAVWGTGPEDVWVVGQMGTLVHGGQSGFSAVASGVTENLVGVWGSAAEGEVWAVGQSGTVLRRAGSGAFATQNHGLGTGLYYSMWLGGRDDVWIVGSSAALHHDGRSWMSSAVPLDVPVSVWGSAVDDVWAVGRSQGAANPATISRFNGVAWVTAASPVATPLLAVRGSSETNVWAVGESGVVMRLQVP